LDSFPGHQYRYIDQTGSARPPVSSLVKRDDLNNAKYEGYFTVNGFDNQKDATKESCTSLNSFFCDIDGRKDPAELEEIKKKLDPTFIIETMNGWHCYWLLDEPVYRDEVKDWNEQVSCWEKIEQSLVTALRADNNAKDLCRILRQPDTTYWKKTDGKFKIKGIYKNLANRYSMDFVASVFPITETTPTIKNNKSQGFADAERKDFFDKVNKIYPIEERDSFVILSTGRSEVMKVGERNHALLVTASLMRDAGWSKPKALKHFVDNGWYGIEKERGGMQEIYTTVNSAFDTEYHFSYKDPAISANSTPGEQIKIQDAYSAVFKLKKENDKFRFAEYEKEILNRFPYIRKNEIGIIFNYSNGVYKMMTDLEIDNIIYNALYDDMLWNYRTQKNVSDKTKCLLSIIPDLILTNDKGHIVNVKNGLLDIYTKELKPHTPDFISLVQLPVMFDSKATAPVWEKCLEAWMAGPEIEEKKLLLQEFSGYLLTSSMLHDKAMFLIGDGGNGKSTFVDTLARVIGPEGTSHIDLESLYGQYGMKGLIGKRLNVIEEVHGNYYQSNKLKKLISGESLTIDIKYKDQFSFRPQAKFIFAVNIMPRVDDTSTATERRICAVVFRNNFRHNPNVELRSDMGLLAQELSGILNWMLKGAEVLKEKKGFITTQEQIELLGEYRQENSSVEAFIAECLDFVEGVETETNHIYEEYKKYCQSDGRKFKAKISFTKELKAYGHRYGKFSFLDRQNTRGSSTFEGVKINESALRTEAERKYQDF
jgi:putative DNA primase/helicase